MTTKEQEVFCVAQELFRQNPDWVTFFREVLGLEGIVRQAFPTPDAMTSFEKCEEYTKIQAMLAQLRKKGPVPTDEEPTTVITVRLPKSLHDTLKAEAHDRRTSMNKLCIAKLLQVLELEMAAEEFMGGEISIDRPANTGSQTLAFASA